MNPARLRAYIELLIVSVIWGFAAAIIKYTLGGFPPFIFLTYRFFISSIIAVVLFVFIKSKLPKSPKVWALTLFNGFLLSTVSLGLLFLGTDKTTSIDSNLISAMAPITIAIAGVFFLKEHVTKRESFGILIALAGTLITVIEPVLKFQDGFGGLTGNLLVFASIIVGAATAVLAKLVLRNNVDALISTSLSFIVGFLTLAPFTLPQILNSRFQILTSVPFSYHLGVFYMAILSGTVAYYLWHKAHKTIEISEASLFAYLYPIFGVPLSVLWLKEKITIPFIIGSVIIAIGVILAEWKKKAKPI
jgi:drug/metabolite transporter (DMT)-like permease